MGASTDKRIAALDWAARGFRVFRLTPGTKIPPKGSRWTEEATTDPEVIDNWWRSTPECNIGVLCDGLCVVDIDVKNGKQGLETYRQLGLPQDTLVVKTPTGGFHVYFTGETGNSSGRLGPGLDTRGEHGYVLAPGSVLENGAYTLVRDMPLQPVPDEVVRVLGGKPDREVQRDPVTEIDTPDAVASAIAYLQDAAPLAVETQNGDDTTFKVAARLKDEGLSPQTAFNLLAQWWNDRCLPPWPLEDLRTKVVNAYSYGQNAPGSARPEAHFKGVILEQEPGEASEWEQAGDPWGAEADWLLYQCLPASGVAMIVGHTQSGKTFLLGHLARCLTKGDKFFGIEPDVRGAVAFLTGGGEGSGFRQRMAGEVLPIFHKQILPLNIAGRLDALVEDLKALSLKSFNETGLPLRVVVFETLSTVGLIEKENDNAVAAVAINAFNRIARDLGCLVIFSHHSPKNAGGARGAGAIEANVDFAWEINRTGPVRDLHVTKARNAPQRQIGSFTLPTTVLGVDSRGREVTTCTISESIGEHSAKKLKSTAFSELFMECLDLELQGDTWTVEGYDAVPIEQVREMFKERKSGSKDSSNVSKAFKGAMDYCVDAGAVKYLTAGGEKYLAKNEIGST